MDIKKEQVRKMIICALSGFSSGMPLFFFLNLLPVWLRSELVFVNFFDWFSMLGSNVASLKEDLLYTYIYFFSSSPYLIAPSIDLKNIGMFSLLQLPYTLKFLWAPLLDRYSPLSIGGRRGWMLVTQIALMFTMMAYAWVNPSTEMFYVIVLSLLLTFFSATQDVSIDAFRREILTDEELGLGNSIYVTIYRLAILVPGSLSLILSDLMPWPQIFIITALFMFVGIFMVFIAEEPSKIAIKSKSFQNMLVDPLVEYWERKGFRNLCFIIAFFILYKLGDSLAVSLSSIFYYDIGYSRTVIGSIAKYAQISASVIGGVVGGLLMLKIGINRALWGFGLVQITSILGFVWLASFGKFFEITMKEQIYLAIVVAYEYFGIGLGTAAFVSFMAREVNPMYAATQISLLSAIATIPRSFIGGFAGFLVEYYEYNYGYGYYYFFWTCFFLAIPGILILFKTAPWNGRTKQYIETKTEYKVS
ncbi:MAG: MFS transporter [Neisseriaceae bacterium]|nr:MAG: MFS transporter [Neisseriaceae bacterium]